MRRAARSALVAVAGTAIATAGCGLHGARVALPAGAGEARADYATVFAAATATCRPIHKLTADLALSGNAGRQRLGGHVLAGFAPDALRLEGVAPFGGPIFILAAENGKGTLLLPRERHAVESGPPSEILEALVGVGLSPDDLLAVLTGCVKASAAPVSGRMYGADWLAIDLNGGVSGRATAYLRRANSDWPVVAATVGGLQIDYGARTRGLPAQLRISTMDPGRTPRVDLQVRMQSFEIDPEIERAAFSVTIPPGTSPITLQDLRESYHR